MSGCKCGGLNPCMVSSSWEYCGVAVASQQEEDWARGGLGATQAQKECVGREEAGPEDRGALTESCDTLPAGLPGTRERGCPCNAGRTTAAAGLGRRSMTASAH